MPKSSTSPIYRLASLLFPLLFSFGCVTLTPYASIRGALPEGDRLTIDGRTVHVAQRGEGEPLLLLHGFGESTYSWRKVVPDLSAHYRTIAIDLYGFGYTERPKEPAAYSRDGQLRLILGVLDTLGIESAHVAGHSYGGALTLALAALHPERVRSLILIDSAAPTYPDSQKSSAGRSRTLARLGIGFALRPSAIRRSLKRAYYDDSQATPEVTRAYFERLAIEGALDAYAGLSSPPPSTGPPIDLRQIRKPSLWIWGEDDRLVKIAPGRIAASKIPGSTFVALPRCGHSPMEERPDEVVRAILAFRDAMDPARPR